MFSYSLKYILQGVTKICSPITIYPKSEHEGERKKKIIKEVTSQLEIKFNLRAKIILTAKLAR